MRLFSGRIKDSTKSTLVAGFFAISQLIFPFMAVTPVSAAHGDVFTPIASSSGTSPSVQIDQCRNGGGGEIQCINSAWVSGSANGTQANYFEGDSIPYRSVFKNLSAGETYTLEIEWDSTEGGDHAIDYITSFDRTLADADPCSDVFSDCVGKTPHTFAIPTDPNVSAEGVIQEGGDFSIYNGTITAVSNYTLTGTYAGSSQTSLTVTFTADAEDWVVLAWGGHISTRADWGLENAAVNIPGSPFHMRLQDFTCSNIGNCSVGQQDRSLSSDAVTFPADITIVKQASPEGDTQFAFSGDFGEFSLTDDGTSANTQTFEVTEFGEYNITETVPDGWSLNNITCDFDDASQGSVVSTAPPTATIDVEEGDIVTCTFQNDLDEGTLKIVKNVINDDGGDKTYADFTFKVDSEPAQSFDADATDIDGYDGVKELTLPVGTYNVTEPQADTMGYSTSYENCSSVEVTLGQTTTCIITNNDNAPSLTLVKTVTNDNGGDNTAFEWTLNASDGNTALIDEAPSNELVAEGVSAATDKYKAVAGVSYSLNEYGGPSGYTAGMWSCEDQIQNPVTVTESAVTLGLDQDVTCEIKNNDNKPQLTLIKDISQFDNNGAATASDFVLHLTGGDFDLIDDFSTGDTPTVDANVTYTLSEEDILNSTGQPGYELDRIECVIDGTDTSVLIGENQVELDEGQYVTCTFFNDDIAPLLTVTKTVINDDGGTLKVSDFPLYVGDELVVSDVQNDFDAGLYVVSEQEDDNYEASDWGGDCKISGSITLEVGGTYTCNISNDDTPPTLKLVKKVVNDYGDPAAATEWTLYATPENDDYDAVTLSGDGGFGPVDAKANVTYTLSESLGVNGYESDGKWDCSGTNGLSDDNQLTLSLGDAAICEIVNEAEKPALTIVKKVINDNGGTTEASAFVLKVNGADLGQPDATGSAGDESTATWNYENVQTGTPFTVSEIQKSGYKYDGMVCEDDDTEKPVTHPVTLSPGQSVTCTLTNDDISPSLTLVKKVVKDDGGEKEQDAWTLTALGPDLLQGTDTTESLETGVTDNVKAGTYSLSESDVDGYQLTSIVCNNETLKLTEGTGQITLGLADNVTCVFTNDDIAPTLRLVKETETVNDNPTQVFELNVEQDEDGLTDDFYVDTDETNDDYLNTVVLDGEDGLMAGNVTVGEVVPEGWELDEISCNLTVSEELIGAEYNDDSYDFTLYPGDDVTCTFVNAEQPDIKVTKYWDINQNGEFDEEEEETLEGWSFHLRDEEDKQIDELTTDETGSTTFENLSPFSEYTLSEVLQDGWNLSGITCEYESEQGDGFADGFNSYTIEPAPGETVECYVGNYQDSQLFIEKTNNRIGDQLVAGDSVVYTITVSNPEDSGIVYDNVTYDIMPEAVSYTAGTWTAVSDVRGSIAGALDEGSDYASDGPATWELGDIAPGETVTLTYAATVDADTEPGTYENVAWNEGWACEIKLPYLERPVDVRAEDLLNVQAQYTDEVNSYSCFSDDCEYDYTALEHSRCRTYGNLVSVFAQDESDDDPFVESAITVVAEEDEQGFVLGVLSVTGVPAILPTAVGLTLVSAALLLSRAGGNRKQRRWLKGLAAAGKNLLVALVMTLAFSAGAIAAAPWQLNVVDLPDTTSDNTPQISYTVAAADAADTFTVELYQNTDLIETQNITSAHGGSGQFNVPEVADGDYDFSVLVTNNNTSATKEHTEAVVIDTDTPSAPVYEGVERSGNTYTLNFTVPSGDVNKVRIYASTNTEFELNGSNLVRTLNVTPGEDVETTYIAPDSQQRFFAVVAVDSAGNTSAPSGDSETVVVDSQGNPVTTGSTNNTGGTTGGDGDNGGAVLPDQDDTGNGDDANDNGTDANGDAADTTDDSEDESTDDDGTNGWFIALLVAAILGMGYYYFGRNSER